jgi:hypothetical protein
MAVTFIFAMINGINAILTGCRPNLNGCLCSLVIDIVDPKEGHIRLKHPIAPLFLTQLLNLSRLDESLSDRLDPLDQTTTCLKPSFKSLVGIGFFVGAILYCPHHFL